MSLTKKYFYKRNDEEKIKNMTDRHFRTLSTINKKLNMFHNKTINKKDKFLDMGCGDGSFVKFLQNNNIDAVGCDINETNFEKDKLKYNDESFDFIMLYSVIEHVLNTDNLLNEAHRVLKKNGNIIIITPNFRYCFSSFYDDPTHVKPFTDEGLKKLLELYNFNKIFVKPWTVNYNNLIWKISFGFFYCANIIPFRNDLYKFLPKFLKGRSQTMIATASK